jgi:hypothetical protein
VLEEALAAARAARTASGADAHGDGVWEVQRRFQSIADVLVAVGAIDRARAQGIVRELHDALAVRELVPASGFLGSAVPPAVERVRQPGEGWLEAEIEHHLDLVVDLRPPAHADVAVQVLANLRPQVRALQAVGAVRTSRRLDDLAATFDAAGYAAPEHARGDVDRGWLSFLRTKPTPLRPDHAPSAERAVQVAMGNAGGAPVWLNRLAWSADVLELTVDAPAGGEGAWRASAFDDAGQLHLGQPGVRADDGAGPLTFRLRPGLSERARSLAVRVTFGATRLDERASLA